MRNHLQTIEPMVFVPFFVSLMVFFVLVSVAAQKKRSRVKTAFTLFIGDLFTLTVIDFILKLPIGLQIEPYLFNLGILLLCYSGILHLYFMYAVVDRRLDTVFKMLAVLAVGASFVVLIADNDRLSLDALGKPIIMLTPAHALGLAIGALTPGLYGIFICVKHLRKPKDEREQRIMKLVITGTTLSLVLSVFFVQIIPVLMPWQSDMLQFSSLAVLVHAVYMSKAVSRYHFLAINYDEIDQVSRSLFENVGEAVVIFGASGEVVQSNQPARKLLGEEITKTSIRNQVEGYDFSKSYDQWRTSLFRDGVTHQVALSQSDIGQGKNPAVGKLLLIRDVEDELRAQKERRLIERRAQQSEKLEAIGQLAGGVAHDFNNQLAGIIGYADLLKQDMKGNAKGSRFVDGIILSARRAADVTSQLLAYARKGQYLNVEIDIRKTVQEVVSILSHSIDKRIRVITRLTDDDVSILGDPSQIQNALLNLGLNARDAMEAGGELTYQVELTEVPKQASEVAHLDLVPGMYVLLSVRDTGIGMDDKVRERIFEPFFTTKPEGKGTGLGLAAVYGTVKNHGGAVRVTSAPSKGSTFRIYLPVYEGEESETASSDSNAPPVQGAGRILIVDDEPVILETTSAILERLGYEVVSEETGMGALARFEKEARNLDLIILDLMMPEMDGESLFKKIRAIDRNAKVLVASGYAIDDTAHRLIEAGAAGFIQKPFRHAALSRQVAEILRPSE